MDPHVTLPQPGSRVLGWLVGVSVRDDFFKKIEFHCVALAGLELTGDLPARAS